MDEDSIMPINFSFIIPHHNTLGLLVRLLDSIPSRCDSEIIIVDDNSDISQRPKLSTSNIRLIQIEKKDSRGAGKARNLGLSEARGKWVFFADSDDVYTIMLEPMMIKYMGSSADIVFFNTESVLNSDLNCLYKSIRCKDYLFNHYQTTGDSDVFRYMYKEPWGKMFNREFLVKNNLWFDETPVANDYFFSVKSGCLAKLMEFEDTKIYKVTHREGSLSFDSYDTKEKLLARVYVTLRVQLFLEKNEYVFRPMLVRSLMKVLLKRYPMSFFKTIFSRDYRELQKWELFKEMLFSLKLLRFNNRKEKSYFPVRIR